MDWSPLARRLPPFGIAAGVFVCDRLTKAMIEANVTQWDTFVVIPNVFNIVHTRNRGAAFGMFAESSGEWRAALLVGLALAVLGLITSLLWQACASGTQSTRSLRVALALVMGGALGNLWDRIMTGSVTDFLQVFIGSYEWPSFNVADSAITIGASLLVLDLWRNRRLAVRT